MAYKSGWDAIAKIAMRAATRDNIRNKVAANNVISLAIVMRYPEKDHERLLRELADSDTEEFIRKYV